MLRASQLARYDGDGERRLQVPRSGTRAADAPRMPQGSARLPLAAARRASGTWRLKDGADGSDLEPRLSFLDRHDAICPVDLRRSRRRSRRVAAASRCGTSRPAAGQVRGHHRLRPALRPVRRRRAASPASTPRTTTTRRRRTRRPGRSATPGSTASDVHPLRARVGHHRRAHRRASAPSSSAPASTSGTTANLSYRAAIAGLVLCGCVGRNGGGLNHYVGQEKLAPVAPWALAGLGARLGAAAAAAERAQLPLRAQRSVALRADRRRASASTRCRDARRDHGHGHTLDHQVRAVRRGWLPFYPQFDRSPSEVVREAEAAGARTDAEMVDWVVRAAAARRSCGSRWRTRTRRRTGRGSGSSGAATRSCRAPRGTSTSSSTTSARTTTAWREEVARDEVTRGGLARGGAAGKARPGRRPELPDGHLGALLRRHPARRPPGTRRTTSTPPTCTPSSIRLQAAVPPCWEAKSDWDIFKALAEKVSELARRSPARAGPRHRGDAAPARHAGRDGAARDPRLDQGRVRGRFPARPCLAWPWSSATTPTSTTGSSRAGPVIKQGGPLRARHHLAGRRPLRRAGAEPAHGGVGRARATRRWPRRRDAANVILHLAPETNGESAYRAFQAEEKKVGRDARRPGGATRAACASPSRTSRASRGASSTARAGRASPGAAAPTPRTA